MSRTTMKGSAKIFGIAMRESFIAMVPYTFLTSISLLIVQALSYSGFELGMLNTASFRYVSSVLHQFFPLAILLSISYHLSKRFNINHIVFILLSFAIFITIEALLQTDQTILLVFNGQLSFLNVLIPITSLILLVTVSRNVGLYSVFDQHVDNSFKFFIPATLTYFISVLVYVFVLSLFSSEVPSIFSNWITISEPVLFFIRNLISHLIWFIGIHGSMTFDTLTNDAYLSNLAFSNMDLSYKAFYDLFVIYGGSGASLSLILAILIGGEGKNSRGIAKLALPFSLFNINEIVIYGLPIVFNRTLLLPFLMVPMINMVIAYGVLNIFVITIVDTSIPWTTPIFINAYLMTGGNALAISLQLFLLLLGIIIYLPFVKRYTQAQSIDYQRTRLTKGLELTSLLQGKEGIALIEAKNEVIETNHEIEKVISLINSGTLMLYFQPKIDSQTHQCVGFEALLRLKKNDGLVVSPYFLVSLETAGLAAIIDLWVARELKDHLITFANMGFYPSISMNLHPDTIANDATIREISHLLENENVQFEIIERAVLEDTKAKDNLIWLQRSGFNILIDDFGTGYSSFDTLLSLPISNVKIDKSLIAKIETEQGYTVIRHIAELCVALNYTCTAEGVETKQQLELVREAGVHLIQGYYFCAAMPAEAISAYSPEAMH